MRKVISTDKAPGAIGPYNQAIVAENCGMLFTAGQLGVDPTTGDFVAEDVQAQTRQALENLKAVLEAGGSDLAHVVKTTVFLDDMNDFAAMNEVYAKFFTDNPPARSAVEVAKVPKNGKVEIEAIAIVK